MFLKCNVKLWLELLRRFRRRRKTLSEKGEAKGGLGSKDLYRRTLRECDFYFIFAEFKGVLILYRYVRVRVRSCDLALAKF